MSLVSASPTPVKSNRSNRRRYAQQLRVAYLWKSGQLHIREAMLIGGVCRLTILRWGKELMVSDDPMAAALREKLRRG